MTLPLTIVTGFLGAGKTTLLQRALERGVLGRVALLVNEFGVADIDGALLAGAAAGAPLVRLPNGCVCCKVQDDFIGAVRALGQRVAAGEMVLDRIVLETSGLADPAPLLAHLLGARPLREVIGAVRVVAVVDGLAGARALADHVEARHQVACADLILLSKADRLDDAALQRWREATLPAYGAQAVVIAAREGLPEDAQWLARLDHNHSSDHIRVHDHGPRHEHCHDDDPSHDRPATAAHSHGIASFRLCSGPLTSREQWQGWASTLLLLHAEQLLRLKGFVAFAGEAQRQIVQGAMDGLRLSSRPGAQRAHAPRGDALPAANEIGAAERTDTEIVVIARGMEVARHRDGLRRTLLAIAADAVLDA